MRYRERENSAFNHAFPGRSDLDPNQGLGSSRGATPPLVTSEFAAILAVPAVGDVPNDERGTVMSLRAGAGYAGAGLSVAGLAVT